MSAFTTTQHAADEFREVHILDGRRVKINLTGRTTIASDIRDLIFDYSWRNADITWHNSVTAIILSLMQTHSLVYASQCLYFTGRFANLVALSSDGKQNLHVDDLSNWPEHLGVVVWPFFQAILNYWVRSGYPGLDKSIKDFLRSPEKWEEEGNGWYFALVANDPKRGALTEQELRSIRDSVNQAFERGLISLKNWTLTWFLIATGVRPVQIARMTIADVLVTMGPEGSEVTLSIPLAKGENQIVRDRWKRKAPSVLAEALILYLNSNSMRAKPAGSPLFDDQSVKISNGLKRVFEAAETYSERLKGPIPLFPYRFRYTLGTRAIALGASDHEAARLLTHRTTHCIQYYRAAMPMLQRPIRDAIGPEMTFLAQAFQGRLIGSLEEATRRGEPGAIIRDFAHMMGQSLGACGTRAECHQDAPRACLSCRKFEPLKDAPWEQFLTVLQDDLSEESEDRIRLITQEQIDAVRGIIVQRDGLSMVAA